MTGDSFFFESADGLPLHARVRRHPAATTSAPSVICLPGLTRNERDFEGLAGWLTGRAFTGPALEVITLSFRGRGASARDEQYLHYHPNTYVGDVKALMAAHGIYEAIFIGTSLGGIVTMLMAASDPSVVTAALLNDIGPDLAPAGLQRIMEYVGNVPVYEDWSAAAVGVKAIYGAAHPGRDDTFWKIFARRTCRAVEGGVTPDYDPKIADALVEAGPAPALAPGFAALEGPILSVRGETSDLFTEEIQAAMKGRQPQMQTCTVPKTGHAPTLEESVARKAILNWLNSIQLG